MLGIPKRIFFIYCLTLFAMGGVSPVLATELTTAFQKSYPKYYTTDSEGQQIVTGLCFDILKAIEKTAGIKITAPLGFLPFKRLQVQLATGDIDIFVGMAKNETRLKQYIFIETPLYEVNHTVAVRRDDHATILNFDSIRNLAPDNIILTNFGTATERFLNEQQGLFIDSEGANLKINLKKLVHKRGRLICFHDIGLLSAIKQYGYEEKVKILPCILNKYYHYIALSPTTPQATVSKIENAVLELSRRGEFKKIRSRYVSFLPTSLQ